jgi:glycosyltransferase involved in cell wall biosynthesis
MKVCLFTDPTWSLGRVANGVQSSLKEYTIDIIGVSPSYTHSMMWDIYNKYDVIIVNLYAKAFFDHIPDKRKILYRSDGFTEFFHFKLDLTDTYAAVGEQLIPMFPVGSKVFWTPNGVDPSQFIHTERDGEIRKVGWCGAPRVWFKQIEWALEITNRCCIPFSIASSVPCEDNYQIWEPLTYDQVRDWYHTIDILLITSFPDGISETGPLPAFEAIVSGVPVIGTPTGNFEKVPGPKFKTIEEGIEILSRLRCNPDEMKELAKAQYDYVMNHFTYDVLAPKWRDAIEYVHDLSRKDKT